MQKLGILQLKSQLVSIFPANLSSKLVNPLHAYKDRRCSVLTPPRQPLRQRLHQGRLRSTPGGPGPLRPRFHRVRRPGRGLRAQAALRLQAVLPHEPAPIPRFPGLPAGRDGPDPGAAQPPQDLPDHHQEAQGRSPAQGLRNPPPCPPPFLSLQLFIHQKGKTGREIWKFWGVRGWLHTELSSDATFSLSCGVLISPRASHGRRFRCHIFSLWFRPPASVPGKAASSAPCVSSPARRRPPGARLVPGKAASSAPCVSSPARRRPPGARLVPG